MKTKDLAGHGSLRLKAANAPHRMTTLISGRVSVIASLFVFLICYLSGIIRYGVVPGIALGWLPSMLVAWLSAHAVFDLTQVVLRALLPFKEARTGKS